jgi:hypothetical protein
VSTSSWWNLLQLLAKAMSTMRFIDIHRGGREKRGSV